MVSITFKRSLSIDTQRGYVAAVEPGVPYLLTDYHLGESIPRELTSTIEPFNEFERFDGRSLDEGSLLIMWLAGLGDTISAAPALLALQEQNPAARIDMASATRLFEIFCASGFRGRLLNYPTTTQAVREYDYFLPLERGGEDPDYLRLDSIDFYAKCMFQPPGLRPARFRVDETAQRKMILPAKERPRVGIQVRGLSPLRTYPPDLLAELLRELVRLGYEIHLMGSEGDCDIPTAPPLLHNQCGSTANFAETLALVRQMDAVICPDSYLMHLAGALCVPTVALFSTMPARLRTGRYHSVLALEPDTPCAPCMAIQDQQCPEGHSECLALRSGLLAPTAVIEALESIASRTEPQPVI